MPLNSRYTHINNKCNAFLSKKLKVAQNALSVIRFMKVYANSVKFALCIVLELAFGSKSSERLMILELFDKFGISGELVVCML